MWMRNSTWLTIKSARQVRSVRRIEKLYQNELSVRGSQLGTGMRPAAKIKASHEGHEGGHDGYEGECADKNIHGLGPCIARDESIYLACAVDAVSTPVPPPLHFMVPRSMAVPSS